MDDKTDVAPPDLVELSAEIVSAYVVKNAVPGTQLPELIAQVHHALQKVGRPPAVPEPAALRPAVPIRRSVTPEHIVCLEDGKRFKSLRRHLSSRYGMTPEQYRAKWGLPNDYPMVAPNYAAQRSSLARAMGLGQKRGKPAAKSPAPARSARKRAKAADTGA